MSTAQNTNFSKKGFSLIELLVVIAIIAVLAVAGFAAFRGFTSRGNDTRRLADIGAIADALEANKTAAGYQVLATNQFVGGAIPTDPASPKVYCVSSATTPNPTIGTKPAAWAAGTCPAAAVGAGVNGTLFSPVSASPPAPAAGTTAWMVCTTLQDGIAVECKSSAQ
jgi:prepilin-type N-terminal cleavage/methylation domain-containing protein